MPPAGKPNDECRMKLGCWSGAYLRQVNPTFAQTAINICLNSDQNLHKYLEDYALGV
jgi:hypothetical protein